MKILIDMNRSPGWVAVFQGEDWQATHWSEVGSTNASDPQILEFASANGYVLFTHDLDFGFLLSQTSRQGPSVIQLRSQETSPNKLGAFVVNAIRQLEEDLRKGALITIHPPQLRARILPLR